MAWRGQSLQAPVPLPGAGFVGPHPKSPRWSSERGPGRPGTGWSRVAGAAERKRASVGAPSTPQSGVTVRTRHERNGQPARKLAAREEKGTLFDTVRKDMRRLT